MAALSESATITLDGNLGTMVIPFSQALPAATAADLETAVRAALEVTVTSPRTDISASLDDGVVVAGPPENPGELSWEVDEDRTAVTLTFYNETASGASLQAGEPYTAALTITANLYIDAVPATSFTVAVE